MKFFSELLFWIILVLYFVHDVNTTHLTNSLTDQNSNDTQISGNTLVVNNYTNDSARKKNSLLKKRRRRKKKRPIVKEHTALSIPNLESSLASYPGETTALNNNKMGRKPRKGKKSHGRRNKEKIKSNTTSFVIRNKAHPPIHPNNLVLPTLPLLNGTVTNIKPKISKKTRCSKQNGGCAHICHSSGTEKCECFKGFTLASNGKNCIDVNECIVNNGDCEMNCTNTLGSFQCRCPPGLRLSLDSKTCEDINECLLRNGHGPCQDKCQNTHGGYKCSCDTLKGTKLGLDAHSCIDIDECAEENGRCSHMCINTFGRWFCSCPEGLELSDDFKTCRDINECVNESIKKLCANGCINTQGSYRCDRLQELQNDDTNKRVVCKPLLPPQNGYFKCSRKHALKTKTKSGKKRIKNRLGSKCVLVCPKGFKREGLGFRVTCGHGGQWVGNMDAKCISIA